MVKKLKLKPRDCNSDKFITKQLTPSELKKLRSRTFIERNTIIQDKLNSCKGGK